LPLIISAAAADATGRFRQRCAFYAFSCHASDSYADTIIERH
jgi:hypothetical protein